VPHWLSAIVLLGVLTGFAAMLTISDLGDQGRVLWSLREGRGLHVRDVPVIGMWLLAVGAVALLLN
jgi:hypothetical protein